MDLIKAAKAIVSNPVSYTFNENIFNQQLVSDMLGIRYPVNIIYVSNKTIPQNDINFPTQN
ncbi:hypothetical protein NB16F74_35100 [Escherichia coli]